MCLCVAINTYFLKSKAIFQMQVNHYGHTLNFLMRTTAKHIGVVHFVFAKSINIWNKNHSNWLYNCVTFRNGAPFTDAKTSSTKNYMAVPNWVHPTTTTPTKTAEIDIFFSQIEIDLTTPITLPINSQIHTHSECMLHANSHFLFFSMCSKSQSQAVCLCNSQIRKKSQFTRSIWPFIVSKMVKREGYNAI